MIRFFGNPRFPKVANVEPERPCGSRFNLLDERSRRNFILTLPTGARLGQRPFRRILFVPLPFCRRLRLSRSRLYQTSLSRLSALIVDPCRRQFAGFVLDCSVSLMRANINISSVFCCLHCLEWLIEVNARETCTQRKKALRTGFLKPPTGP